MKPELILVLGGGRSGKSAFAERLAGEGGRVLFVATAQAGDEDMTQRIAEHRRRRPDSWDTLEEPIDLTNAIAGVAARYDTVLVDCLTLWVSNLLLQEEPPVSDDEVVRRAEALLDAHPRNGGRWVLVSNEVGLGIVPDTPLGRRYRDVLGRVNVAAARRAGRVYLMVAGLATELKGLGAQPLEDAP